MLRRFFVATGTTSKCNIPSTNLSPLPVEDEKSIIVAKWNDWSYNFLRTPNASSRTNKSVSHACIEKTQTISWRRWRLIADLPWTRFRSWYDDFASLLVLIRQFPATSEWWISRLYLLPPRNLRLSLSCPLLILQQLPKPEMVSNMLQDFLTWCYSTAARQHALNSYGNQTSEAFFDNYSVTIPTTDTSICRRCHMP